MIKKILRKILNVEVEYEGIKASEIVKVSMPHYDSTYEHHIVWEDIYKVYQLSLDASTESIQKLQKHYYMRYMNSSVTVKLRTPLFSGRWREEDDNSNYCTFEIEQVKDFYKQALKNKQREIEHNKRLEERKREEEKKNTITELKDEINKVMNKK
jgi:hypothetical protein